MAITSATTSLAINSALPTTYTESGFSALTGWVVIPEISSLGTYGGQTSVVNFTPVDTGVVVKRSGSVNYGSMQLTMARNGGTAEADLIEAFNDRLPRSFRVALPAALGEEDYFTGVVTSVQTNVQGADNILEMSVTIELDNKTITVTA